MPPVQEANLLEVSLIAFAAVMLILGTLALLIRGLTEWFPEEKSSPEIIQAAIQKAVDEKVPGASVKRIEELN